MSATSRAKTYRMPTGIIAPTTTAARVRKLRHETRWKSAAEVISSRPPPMEVCMTVTPNIPRNVLHQKGIRPMPRCDAENDKKGDEVGALRADLCGPGLEPGLERGKGEECRSESSGDEVAKRSA